MPGIKIYGYKVISAYLEPLVKKGLKSVLIFGKISKSSDKDPVGTHAGGLSVPGPANLGIREIRKSFPDLHIIADVCLCAFTDHGHCGILIDGERLDNKASITRLA